MMRFEVQKVTPEQAEKWLTRNEGNRKLREARAAGLSRAILAGKWSLTHQAIAFSKRGRLLDGQHRLRAIVLARQPVEVVVAYDVPDEAFAYMDAGLPRQMYERLRKDKRHTAICSTVFRLLQSNRVPQEHEAELLMETFGPAMLKMDQITRPTTARNVIKAAPYEGAIMLRIKEAMMDSDEDRVQKINFHMEKLRKGEISLLPPILQSFYRQTAEGVKNPEIGVSPVTDKFVRTWIAFDPAKEDTSRLQVSDHRTATLEAQAVFHEATQGIFDD
jgi:hypothetical protein